MNKEDLIARIIASNSNIHDYNSKGCLFNPDVQGVYITVNDDEIIINEVAKNNTVTLPAAYPDDANEAIHKSYMRLSTAVSHLKMKILHNAENHFNPEYAYDENDSFIKDSNEAVSKVNRWISKSDNDFMKFISDSTMLERLIHSRLIMPGDIVEFKVLFKEAGYKVNPECVPTGGNNIIIFAEKYWGDRNYDFESTDTIFVVSGEIFASHVRKVIVFNDSTVTVENSEEVYVYGTAKVDCEDCEKVTTRFNSEVICTDCNNVSCGSLNLTVLLGESMGEIFVSGAVVNVHDNSMLRLSHFIHGKITLKDISYAIISSHYDDTTVEVNDRAVCVLNEAHGTVNVNSEHAVIVIRGSDSNLKVKKNFIKNF